MQYASRPVVVRNAKFTEKYCLQLVFAIHLNFECGQYCSQRLSSMIECNCLVPVRYKK